MSAVFDKLPSHAPDPIPVGRSCSDNDTAHPHVRDPFVLVDEAGGERAETESINKATADRARSQASDNIDWLPQYLKDRVDQHRPVDGDIDAGGNVNKERLTEEAEKLFGNIRKEMVFCNFYQLKQMVQRFAGYWGFFVITQNNLQLVCFYTESSTKAWQANVSPSQQRERKRIKTGCGFVIRAANHPIITKTAKRHRTPVRITTFALEHGAQCQPGLKEQRIAQKATGGIFGALDLQKLGPIVQIIAHGTVATNSQLRRMLKDHLPGGYEITADDLRNIRVRCVKYVEQSGVPATVSREELEQLGATLVDLACSENATPEMSAAIYAAILQLQEVARGEQPIENVDMIVETARQASQS
jgi:hypothetical protein